MGFLFCLNVLFLIVLNYDWNDYYTSLRAFLLIFLYCMSLLFLINNLWSEHEIIPTTHVRRPPSESTTLHGFLDAIGELIMSSNVSAATFLTSLSEEKFLEIDIVKTAVTRILHEPPHITSLIRQLFEKLPLKWTAKKAFAQAIQMANRWRHTPIKTKYFHLREVFL